MFMTTFVNLSYSMNHPGVARLERAFAFAQTVVRRLQQESTYAAALLMFGALSLIASIYDIVETSAQGQELGAWVVLWTALLLCLFTFAKYCKRKLTAWLVIEREVRMWHTPMTDYRVMADLLSAKNRQQ
jgi:hypothetical protein